jgi:hypothetical protein
MGDLFILSTVEPTPTLSPTPGPTPGATVGPTLSPTPSPTGGATSASPLLDVGGTSALWFIGICAAALALTWVVLLAYDATQANKWRLEGQYKLLDAMIGKIKDPTVEEIRQIASALDTPARGMQGLTRSLLGFIIATFVGFALVATLVSSSIDSSDLRKTIITALLSILATISGFYFGARTAQTSSEQATRPPEASPGTRGDGSGSGTGGARPIVQDSSASPGEHTAPTTPTPGVQQTATAPTPEVQPTAPTPPSEAEGAQPVPPSPGEQTEPDTPSPGVGGAQPVPPS